MANSDRFVTCLLVVVACCAGVAGCGGKEEAEPAASKPATPAATDAGPAQPAATGKDERRMANAVTTGKAGAALDLQYEIAPKPGAGEPFMIELAFVPRHAADSVEVQVSVTSGLRLTSTETLSFESVQAGERYTAQVMVIGDAPGLYYVGLVARMSTKVQTDARTFSIPVVIGDVPVAAKPQPQLDSQGQPIAPMPAEESAGT